jgi:hypothetical protein
MAYSDRVSRIESGGNPYAKNPRSSAFGLGQFLDSTWLDIIKRHRPDLTTGKADSEILALRSDPGLSQAMIDAYGAENAKVLSGAGFPVTEGNKYLAHFAGPQGALSLLQADPTAMAGSVLGEAALKANPFLKNMTVADLIAKTGAQMGGASPVSREPAMAGLLSGRSGSPMDPMAGLLGSGQLMGGLLSPQQEQEQMEPARPPPMPMPMARPPIDLSRLRAMIQQPLPFGGAFS